MKKYESGFIKPEDIKVQTYIRHEHNITRYDEVKIIHIPTGISSFASSLNGQLAAYSMAMIMLEDKLIKAREKSIQIIQITKLNKSLDSLKEDLKGRPKQYEAMAAGYINRIKELKENG